MVSGGQLVKYRAHGRIGLMPFLSMDIRPKNSPATAGRKVSNTSRKVPMCVVGVRRLYRAHNARVARSRATWCSCSRPSPGIAEWVSVCCDGGRYGRRAPGKGHGRVVYPIRHLMVDVRTSSP